ncbi:hypothetical protein OJAV_G00121190 [Oryzias javanicus]|uniref:Uncharacterized protein n=1 Tax=Oryzias javanicus TaxID=123683 RepID=A0A437CSP4_ORYJA|nr:hypothetical protein OJAV_G00121190 [Oryzias javanicus]
MQSMVLQDFTPTSPLFNTKTHADDYFQAFSYTEAHLLTSCSLDIASVGWRGVTRHLPAAADWLTAGGLSFDRCYGNAQPRAKCTALTSVADKLTFFSGLKNIFVEPRHLPERLPLRPQQRWSPQRFSGCFEQD